jgi:site-specific DNA-methyltransferase (adenine-specific)
MTAYMPPSAREDWRTPKELFRKLDAEFAFDLDAAATDENKLCLQWITKEEDALSIDWEGSSIFCNPPYGRIITKWVEKAEIEHLKGKTVVMLLPARTDTKWFQTCLKYEIRFIQGRLKFDDQKYPAPFPSMIVVMK